jgi:predicted ester cyclase
MVENENKRLVEDVINRIFNGGQLSEAEQFVTEDFADLAAPPGAPRGPQALDFLLRFLRGAFPDLQYRIDGLVAEGDEVSAAMTVTGTHLGPFRGHAPTGRSFETHHIHVMRFRGGKICEHWAVRDDLTMLVQLGLVTM